MLLADGARPGDTVADVRRREGESTLGLWLPLAMASLVQCIDGLFGHPPKKSEILEGWMLPHLAETMRREEEQARAEGLGRWVEDIERRFGKREEDGRKEHTTDT